MSTTKKHNGGELWRTITYIVFDSGLTPTSGVFEDRLAAAEKALTDAPYAEAHPHWACRDQAHLEKELARIEGLGGEGLMLRKKGSVYENKRSQDLLKFKTMIDDEALVTGHQEGKLSLSPSPSLFAIFSQTIIVPLSILSHSVLVALLPLSFSLSLSLSRQCALLPSPLFSPPPRPPPPPPLSLCPGKGRNVGRLGALICRSRTGKVFKVGTGFSDEQRENAPAIGSVITFGYFELTKAGIPRFPAYKRIRADVEASVFDEK